MESNDSEKVTLEMVQPLLDKLGVLCAGVNIGIVTHAALCLLATCICQCEDHERDGMLNHIYSELPKMIEFHKNQTETGE